MGKYRKRNSGKTKRSIDARELKKMGLTYEMVLAWRDAAAKSGGPLKATLNDGIWYFSGTDDKSVSKDDDET